MKKIFTALMTVIIMMMTLISCEKTLVWSPIVVLGEGTPYSSVVPQNENGEFGIVFGNYSPYTKAMSKNDVLLGPNQCGYDNFNMYAWKDGSAVMNPYSVKWSDNAWSYDNVDGQQLQYFDRNSMKYDFIGVISNGNESADPGEVIVTNVPAFLDNSDELTTPDELLWTSVTVEKANYASPVSLNFKHANAKMYLGFASDRDDTQIIDYTPYTPGIPGTEGTPAWDEVVEVTDYQMTATTVPVEGPTITDINISDEDIAYVNDKFTASKGFANYATNNVITGPLNEDMYAYLVSKYPALSTATLNNWNTYVTNPNMRLVHINTEGAQYNRYSAVFVNIQNVNFNTGGTTHQETIHHDAIPGEPGTPATGLEGIRVFSVSIDNDGHNIVTNHTTEATAVITDECILIQTAADDEVIVFGKPTSTVAQFNSQADITWEGSTKSPSVWYALPAANSDNGYVVKFSYTYDGVSYYDARVHIPFADSDFEQGVYYTYVVYITSKTNGTTDPNEAEEDKDEVDTDKVAISFVISVTEYSDAGVKTYTLGE